MATKAKKKATATKKSSTKATTAKRAAKTTVRKAKTATRTVAKKARAAKASPIGKAAAKVLAGAAAGAVRAIIPQLEDAAGAQEQAAGNTKAGARGKAGKSSTKA
ncbi:MAG: hypothetical protein ABIR79_15350 [Candidatus Binatia bacterium]